jgi:hypothetical protein
MKKHLLFIFATLCSIIGSASAQSVSIRADVPFNFVVNDRILPSGEYTIIPITLNGSAIRLRSSDSKIAVALMPCQCASAAGEHETKLVFRVAGTSYLLWQIWTAGYDAGREFHLNRELIEEANGDAHQTVTVLAQLGSH